jgi:hypothetical protein
MNIESRLGVVEYSVLDVCFFISRLGVIGRSMFDVHL